MGIVESDGRYAITIGTADGERIIQDPIFLNDPTINPFFGEGNLETNPRGWKTILTADSRDPTVFQFKANALYPGPAMDTFNVTGSFCHYEAKIRRLSPHKRLLLTGTDIYAKPEENVFLYHGGLQIYRSGILPGTKGKLGSFLASQGPILFATKTKHRTIEQAIFDELGKGDDSRGPIIERVIAGYVHQEQAAMGEAIREYI